MEDRDALFEFYQSSIGRMQYWHEDRSRSTNIALAFIAVLSAAIGYDQNVSGVSDAILSLTVAAIGIVALLFVLKSHERVIYFRTIPEELVKRMNMPAIEDAIAAAEKHRKDKYRISGQFKSYRIYTALMAIFIVYGLLLFLIASGVFGLLLSKISC